MSVRDNHRQAMRWLRTAEEDLETALVLLRAHRFAAACFTAQQAAEKAVKAALLSADEKPWGHSIQSLVGGAASLEDMPDWRTWTDRAAILDRFYMPTRYPDSLPDLTPEQVFFEADADTATTLASAFVHATRTWLSARTPPVP